MEVPFDLSMKPLKADSKPECVVAISAPIITNVPRSVITHMMFRAENVFLIPVKMRKVNSTLTIEAKIRELSRNRQPSARLDERRRIGVIAQYLQSWTQSHICNEIQSETLLKKAATLSVRS